ncbi:type VII secretion protein EssA [Staphylococcus pettenkoferi]|uniref:type VII secretion protein EssA n=1 Tax=Staphylococcus pettenkoferi TaxID=170573 RepID=UPI00066D8C11|nr:type VII secretion protein EssA [Staphylococcus pettenkoferi]MDK7115199.1 type VII secretion protein EssA [Staphylococcus pettenkoferi]MDK7283153.1 type VII secretion protein EssA [Staphylococcus pettenkoferi]
MLWINCVVALFLNHYVADIQDGSLQIDTNGETRESKNINLDQYDTELFNDKSREINKAIKKKELKKSDEVKDSLFKDNTKAESNLKNLKASLFTSSEKSSETYTKQQSYIQTEKFNLLSIQAIVGTAIISMIIITAGIVWRKKKGGQHDQS